MSNNSKFCMTCPLDGADMQRKQHDWLFSCPLCGLQGSALAPNIASGALSSRLDEEDREKGLSAVRIVNGGHILEAIQLETRARTLLDVGSGPGFFLSLAKERGFDVTGVEPDPTMASSGMKRGLTVRSGFFPEAMGDEKFDVIVLNDVLEHIPDLTSVFAGFREHLLPGGLLVLNCPNRLGFFYRVASVLDRLGSSEAFRRMWQFGLPSPHVWYFTTAQLRELGEREGFSFVREIQLETLSREGLYSRIAYVKGRPTLFNLTTFAVVWCLLPVLKLLPSDLGVVILKR